MFQGLNGWIHQLIKCGNFVLLHKKCRLADQVDCVLTVNPAICSVGTMTLVVSDSNERPQSFINRISIGKRFCNVRFKAHDINETLPAGAEPSDTQTL